MVFDKTYFGNVHLQGLGYVAHHRFKNPLPLQFDMLPIGRTICCECVKLFTDGIEVDEVV